VLAENLLFGQRRAKFMSVAIEITGSVMAEIFSRNKIPNRTALDITSSYQLTTSLLGRSI